MRFLKSSRTSAPAPQETGDQTPDQTGARGPLARLASVLTLVLGLTVLTLLFLTVALPALLGWVPLTVQSGSMEPTYPVGSQLVVAPVEGQARKELVTGQVITFMPNPDDPTLVTHRIQSVAIQADGQVAYRTRGDGNQVDDPEPVYDKQVRAVAKYHVPYMGYVAQWLDPASKRTLTMVAVALLAGYALYQVVAAGVEKARRAGTVKEQNDA